MVQGRRGDSKAKRTQRDEMRLTPKAEVQPGVMDPLKKPDSLRK